MSTVVPATWRNATSGVPRPGATVVHPGMVAVAGLLAAVLLCAVLPPAAWTSGEMALAALLAAAVVALVVAAAGRRAMGQGAAALQARAATLLLPAVVALVFGGAITWVLAWSVIPLAAHHVVARVRVGRRLPFAAAAVALVLVGEAGLPPAPEGFAWLGPLLLVWVVGLAAAAPEAQPRLPRVLRIDDLSPRQLRDVGLGPEAAAGGRRSSCTPRTDFFYRPII
jgi:hypothetical protein